MTHEMSIAAGGWDYSPHYPRAVDWNAPIPVRPLTDILDRTVAAYPERKAIDFLGKATTYAELGASVNRAAKGFQTLGVRKGDRVGLFLPNSPYFVIAYFGLLKAGATVVNYNPLYAPREIQHQIDDSDTRLMVTMDLAVLYDKLAPMLGRTALKRIVVASMADALPGLKRLLFPWVRRRDLARIPSDDRHPRFATLVANDGAFVPQAVNPSTDIAVLQYTGGTTGVPKGAMLTHANLSANTEQCRLWFHNMPPGECRTLAVLPLFHVFAMTVVMNLGIAIGSELILLPRFELETVLKTIETKRPTFIAGVPTMFNAIVGAADKKPRDLSSVQVCISGGAPLPLEVKQRFEKLTDCMLVEGYGLTESSPVTHCNPLGGLNKEGSIGLPLPGTRVELRSLDDPRQPVQRGERGEICIGGPQVMIGYWQKPEATAAAFVGGLLRTGDVATLDNDGYCFIVDRIKDMILSGGYNVYPRVIEEAIYQHAAVEECTVIGVPDDYRGQSAKAYVKLRAGKALTAEELVEFLKDKLSPIEMPREIEFRASLPKTLIGKLSKKELVAEEAAKRAAAKPSS
jgi:long-chain acyl-CoA synthetase